MSLTNARVARYIDTPKSSHCTSGSIKVFNAVFVALNRIHIPYVIIWLESKPQKIVMLKDSPLAHKKSSRNNKKSETGRKTLGSHSAPLQPIDTHPQTVVSPQKHSMHGCTIGIICILNLLNFVSYIVMWCPK